MVWAAMSWCSILLVALLHFVTEFLQGSTYTERLGNQVHPMIHTLFPNKDAVFQEHSAHIHRVGPAQSWFEEHEGELQHVPWPAQSPDISIIEPFWSVLENRVRNRFPHPTSRKQLEDVLKEEWYKIPLETLQNLYESILRSNAAVLKAKGGSTPLY
jgi:hypothetical protein